MSSTRGAARRPARRSRCLGFGRRSALAGLPGVHPAWRGPTRLRRDSPATYEKALGTSSALLRQTGEDEPRRHEAHGDRFSPSSLRLPGPVRITENPRTLRHYPIFVKEIRKTVASPRAWCTCCFLAPARAP